MLLIRWRKVLRELWNNKARTLLVVMSIAVGVFAVGTIANSWVVLINDLNTAYLATNPASATLRVSAFDEDLVNAVESRRDIAQAEGRQSAIVKLYLPEGGTVNLNLLAVEDFTDVAISQMTPEEGAWPPNSRQILLERSWLAEFGLTIGEQVTVETADGRTYQLDLAGSAHDLHVISAGNSEVATGYATLDTLNYLGLPTTFNTLYLTVAQNATDQAYITQVVTEVKEQTLERNGFTVLSTTIPTPGEAFLTVIIQAVLGVLAVVGLFSLVLSGALVLNTVSAVVTRQLREIGVMKSIGGERGQIIEIYLASVTIYGLLSLVIAIPLAVVGTRAFTQAFADLGNFDILTTGIPPGVIVLEAAVGLIVPVIAALIPVWQGTRITVREAISDAGLNAESGDSLLDRIANRLRGLPESMALALRNTFRRKARLGLTLATLTLAGAIFVAVLSVRSSLFTDLDRALVYYGYDLSVDLGDSYRLQQIEREANRIGGIAAVEGWLTTGAARVRPDGSESSDYSVIGLPPDSIIVEPELVEGRWVQPGDRNAIVVNTDFLREETDVQLGDTLTLTLGEQEAEWEIVGIITKQYNGPILYAGIDDLGRELNRVGFANRALIALDNPTPQTEAVTAAAVEDRFQQAGILVGSTTTSSDFIETFSFRFNFLVIFLLALAVMLAFVGGLGLAGTMGLNVLERVREIGVMRAIGAPDGVVQRIILTEGIVIGAMSWVLAAALALPLSKALSAGVGLAFAGEPLTFTFSLMGALVWLVLVIVIAAVSSYLPARRAAQLSVRETLAYE